MNVPASSAEDRSLTLCGYRWKLRYSAKALRAIQLTFGSLTAFMSRLVSHSFGQGLTLETQAFLIWAGQLSAEPKLKRGEVIARLTAMDPRARYLLVTLATSECIRAILEYAGAEIAKILPPSEDENA